MKTKVSEYDRLSGKIASLKIIENILKVILFSYLLFLASSCRSSYTCPTYADTPNVVTEQKSIEADSYDSIRDTRIYSGKDQYYSGGNRNRNRENRQTTNIL